MDTTKIIALQKLMPKGGVLAVYAATKCDLGRMPESADDLFMILKSFRKEKISDREISLSEIKKSLSDAQRIVEESAEQDIGIVSYFDEDFPEALKSLKKNNPLVLYYKGNIRNVSKMYAIAIIGTRHPTEEGVKMGRLCGEYFGKEGFNIVSGLALGCDTAAHTGALKAKGITTAFVAHGLDIVHPQQNEALVEKIIDTGGAIISEYPTGTPVGSQNLVERNRLQAGLSDAVILIQSDLKKGGSMHAVNIAIENNKPVFAIDYHDAVTKNHQMTQGNNNMLVLNKAKPLNSNNLEEVIKIIENQEQ